MVLLLRRRLLPESRVALPSRWWSRMILLRCARQRHNPAQGHTQDPARELELRSHRMLRDTLHLIRLARLVRLVFLLHRLRQLFQRIEV